MSPIFFAALLIASLLVFSVHLAVYRGLASIFAISSPGALMALKAFLIIFGAGFIGALILASYYNNQFTRIFYTATAVWYGFLVYLFLAVAVYSIFSLVFGSSYSGGISILGKVLFATAIAAGAYGLWNAENIKVARYQASMPNMPEAWRGKRLVWASDIHLGQVHGAGYSEKIVSLINSEEPDIVVIGGDLYDGVKIDEAKAIEAWSKLRPAGGIYFITGNHEEFGDKTHFLNVISNLGVKVLNNEKVDIDGVDLIGVDDRDSTKREVFEGILSGLGIKADKAAILLKHRPFQLDQAEKAGIDIQISGHTHRAQVWPLSYITRFIYKGYDYGYKQYGNMAVYTSSGVGTWGPPLRVGTGSEIMVLDF